MRAPFHWTPVCGPVNLAQARDHLLGRWAEILAQDAARKPKFHGDGFDDLRIARAEQKRRARSTALNLTDAGERALMVGAVQ